MKQLHLGLRWRATRFFCALCCAALATALPASAAQETYKPKIGQKGKDVVWIPSPEGMVEKMLDMARVTPQDFVIDLGSGDGRNVIAAARRGARALGVEYNADLVVLSRDAAAAAGVADKATFVQGDMYEADISKATVLVLFLIPMNLWKLTPKFLQLAPGTRIVSNTYEIGGGWEPDETDRLPQCLSWCVAHLYVVPADIAGTWALPDGELALEQQFQNVTGTREIGGIQVPVENGKLRGSEIRFTVNAVEYTGIVKGDTMHGTARGRVTSEWTAKRIGR
jgi:RNA cap guanine-N2 methyltransferase